MNLQENVNIQKDNIEYEICVNGNVSVSDDSQNNHLKFTFQGKMSENFKDFTDSLRDSLNHKSMSSMQENMSFQDNEQIMRNSSFIKKNSTVQLVNKNQSEFTVNTGNNMNLFKQE